MRLLAIALCSTMVLAAPSDDQVITIAPALLAGLPRASAKVHVHGSKQEAEYDGVALAAILTKSGVASGEAIRGKKLSIIVIARAADEYQAVYSLAELDPAFSKKVFLVADRKNGQPLPESEGRSEWSSRTKRGRRGGSGK